MPPKKKKKARSQWLMSVIPATWEAEIRRVMDSSTARANSSQDLISKITKAKWTAGVPQAVKHLLCKHKALSSNPSFTKKKKKKKGLLQI
jgi:hypothetical protein